MKALLKGLPAALLLTLAACGGASSAPAPSSAPPATGAASAAAKPASPASTAASTSAAAKPAASGSAAAKPAGSAAAPASGGPKEKIRAGYLSHSTTSAITFISKAAGFYDKYGLDVALTFVEPAVLTTALNAGRDFDVGYASAANIPTINVKGGDLVMIAGSAQGGIFSMIANPGIQSIADLKGKKAAVTSSGSTTDLLLRKVLQDNGLTPGKDVSVVVVQGDAALVAALASHQVDAIMNSEPFTSAAVAQGGKVIYDQSATHERAIQTPVTVKRGYLPAHRDALKRLLMANMEAIHMIKTDPAAAAKYSLSDMGFSDAAVLEKALVHAGQGMDPDMDMPIDYLAASLKIAAANVPEVAKLKPEDLVDTSLLEEIKASGFIDNLYK
jgi:ABC-type nitrate/sulfonate/bicarbonate transport system substrate-binding protein